MKPSVTTSPTLKLSKLERSFINAFQGNFFSEILNVIYYSIEEFLEMIGIALFIYSLLLYIKEEIIITIKKTA